MSDSERLDWYQAQHTLHKSLEVLYVVDGYELSVLVDDGRVLATYKGETLREAIDQAMRPTHETKALHVTDAGRLTRSVRDIIEARRTGKISGGELHALVYGSSDPLCPKCGMYAKSCAHNPHSQSETTAEVRLPNAVELGSWNDTPGVGTTEWLREWAREESRDG